MIYRPQRGGLEESMRERVILMTSRAALSTYLKEPLKDIEVKAHGYDERIGWHTWIVTVRGQAVGFTNQEAV